MNEPYTHALKFLAIAGVGLIGLFYYGNPWEKYSLKNHGMFIVSACFVAAGLLGAVRAIWPI